ncbi:MAG: methyltransferase type 11 [Blastopirellula sp.]|nr:MAG: methyltransferase type 11 [Blastopirellula sp.]
MNIFKRLEHNFVALFKLGRTERMAKFASREVNRLSAEIQAIRHEKAALGQTVDDLREDQAGMSRKAETDHIYYQTALAEVRRSFSDLSHRLDYSSQPQDNSRPDRSVAELQSTEGFQAYVDSFYHQLENRLRGSRDDIKNRLRLYLPEVEAAVMRTGNKPALDIGCGRGEWLELLADVGISAFGVDSSPAQVSDAGPLDITIGDALQVLTEQDDNSLSVITAHHLIEHLRFEDVAFITREAMRVLAPEGILIYETPNPRNLLVGASSFYNDPTHRNPMTDAVLQVLFEATGFDSVEMRPLHPHERMDEFVRRPGFDPELAHILFGPQDLAAFGTKPKGTA